MNHLNPQDLTFLFLALVGCLLITSVTLFWSIEDGRRVARSRITKRTGQQ
jgi:CHASE3 domain sensor protein